MAGQRRASLRVRRRHPHGEGRAQGVDRHRDRTRGALGGRRRSVVEPADPAGPLRPRRVLRSVMSNTDVSELEQIKARSRLLRGTLVESLADPMTGAISEDDNKLLKFHGSYQQDDRDLREERRKQKLEPAFQFMVRARLAGGVISPAQWLSFDHIARTWANGTLRITTRQTFQLHGILKHNLKRSIAAMNAALVSTIAACGDVNRNVVA